MPEPKFTPGPWDAAPRQSSVLKSGEVIPTTEIASSRYYWLAQVAVQTGAGNGEGVANAHLIAAAPDLYEYAATEEAYEKHQGDCAYAGCGGCATCSEFEKRIEQLRPAALAKARGEAGNV